jgi:hypothetical protein
MIRHPYLLEKRNGLSQVFACLSHTGLVLCNKSRDLGVVRDRFKLHFGHVQVPLELRHVRLEGLERHWQNEKCISGWGYVGMCARIYACVYVCEFVCVCVLLRYKPVEAF